MDPIRARIHNTDPDTLYLDPDPEICPNFDPDLNNFTRLHDQF